MMNLQMILLSGFYFLFLGILNEIQAGQYVLDKQTKLLYPIMRK